VALTVVGIAMWYSMVVFRPSDSLETPCYPCFNKFKFVDYKKGNLILIDGDSDIKSVGCSADI
jgi:hypothetical protein